MWCLRAVGYYPVLTITIQVNPGSEVVKEVEPGVVYRSF